MMHKFFKVIQIVFVALFFIFLNAFSTLDYTRKEHIMPNLPTGNPDLSVGILVRPDSTGVDILSDSSENIKFTASKDKRKNYISLLSTRMIDDSLKPFTFVDEKYGFKGKDIYSIFFLFNTFATETPIWEFLYFSPFRTSEFLTKEEVSSILNEWVDIFDKAGWKRTEPTSTYYFLLPTKEGINYQRLYCSWITDTNYKAEMNVQLYKKVEYKTIKKIKVYEADIYIANIFIYNLNEYEKFSQSLKNMN